MHSARQRLVYFGVPAKLTMELLLNIFWLLLALPGYLLWRRHRDFGSLRGTLTLACMLVVLFPVISATDDLYAQQQVMEESSPSRQRSLQQGAVHKAPALNHSAFGPAQLVASPLFAPGPKTGQHVLAGERPAPRMIAVKIPASRAPPLSLSA